MFGKNKTDQREMPCQCSCHQVYTACNTFECWYACKCNCPLPIDEIRELKLENENLAKIFNELKNLDWKSQSFYEAIDLAKKLEKKLEKEKNENEELKRENNFRKIDCEGYGKTIVEQADKLKHQRSMIENLDVVIKNLKDENEKFKFDNKRYAEKYIEVCKENEVLKSQNAELKKSFDSIFSSNPNQRAVAETKKLHEQELEHLRSMLQKLKEENAQLKAQLQNQKACVEALQESRSIMNTELSNVLGCDKDNVSIYNTVVKLKAQLQEYANKAEQYYRAIFNANKLQLHLFRYSSSKEILQGFDDFYRDSFIEITRKFKCETCKDTKKVFDKELTIRTAADPYTVPCFKTCPDCAEVNSVDEVKYNCNTCKDTKVTHVGDYSLKCMNCCKEEISEKIKKSSVFVTPKELHEIDDRATHLVIVDAGENDKYQMTVHGDVKVLTSGTIEVIGDMEIRSKSALNERVKNQ